MVAAIVLEFLLTEILGANSVVAQIDLKPHLQNAVTKFDAFTKSCKGIRSPVIIGLYSLWFNAMIWLSCLPFGPGGYLLPITATAMATTVSGFFQHERWSNYPIRTLYEPSWTSINALMRQLPFFWYIQNFFQDLQF